MKKCFFKTLYLCLLIFSFQKICNAQVSDLSFDLQVYPTGIIPGIKYERSINTKSSLQFRLAYNWIRHRDLGVHEDERGDGFGGSFIYKRYFQSDYIGWYLAGKVDIWRNSLAWSDLLDTTSEVNGETKILVFQPTAEAGYTFKKNSLVFTPSIAFGIEWNIITDGEPVGEGLILLLGISVGKRF